MTRDASAMLEAFHKKLERKKKKKHNLRNGETKVMRGVAVKSRHIGTFAIRSSQTHVW